MARYLNPRSDVVFKKVFGQHDHLLVIFINYFLSETDIKTLDQDPRNKR